MSFSLNLVRCDLKKYNDAVDEVLIEDRLKTLMSRSLLISGMADVGVRGSDSSIPVFPVSILVSFRVFSCMRAFCLYRYATVTTT